MKILVLDTVHGGEVIAERYLETGNNVTAVDVYKVTSSETLDRMKAIGVRILESVPAEYFDLVTMPCHCPDEFLQGCTYGQRIFFSDSVRALIDDRRFRIEVTGVKGKTSTCYLLAHILSTAGKKVFLHTSRGQGEYADGEHHITAYKSIAPPSLLTLPEGDYDVMVCEVSLGGSARADIAVITNLLEDYGIAKNTRKAEFGKKAVITSRGTNIVPYTEREIWSRYGEPLSLCGSHVVMRGKPEFGKPLEVTVGYHEEYDVSLPGDYLAMQYLDAMSMALEVCNSMDIDAASVIHGLETFHGVPGRGEIRMEDGVMYLDERNPGISHMSVERTLSCLDDMGVLDKAILIIDPVSRKVCDKMDQNLISEVAAKYNVPLIITSGTGKDLLIPVDRRLVIHMVKEGYQ